MSSRRAVAPIDVPEKSLVGAPSIGIGEGRAQRRRRNALDATAHRNVPARQRRIRNLRVVGGRPRDAVGIGDRYGDLIGSCLCLDVGVSSGSSTAKMPPPRSAMVPVVSGPVPSPESIAAVKSPIVGLAISESVKVTSWSGPVEVPSVSPKFCPPVSSRETRRRHWW